MHKRLKDDDGSAFDELFRNYYIAVHNYANFYIGDNQMAEDLVHDVFLKIWETRRTLKIHTSIKSYLYRSVHNACIQYLRHLKVVDRYNKTQAAKLEEALIMDTLFFETGLNKLFTKEINELVESAIQKLPDKTRTIFLLSRNDTRKNSEIAKELNVSEKTIEYHISRALHVLREELKDYLALIIFLLLIK